MNWTEEQMRAIREEGQNIIVSAGAGSGKTAVLSERVLRKVKEKTSIDRLLILTFTHAAAKEMKDRIRKKLLAENLNQEVEKLDRAYITTFDSFALNLVKKYHMAFNISDHIKISDAIFIEFKEEKILDDILEEFYDQEEESFFKFIQTFCVKDDQILKKNILNLYHKLLLRYDLSTYLNTYMDTYYSDSYINQIITEYFLLIEKKKEKIETLFEKLKASLDQKEIEKYKDLSSFLQEKSYEKMKAQIEISLPRVNKNYGEYEKKIKEEIHSLLKEMKEYFIYENEEQIKTELLSTKENMEILISILKKLHQKVEQVKKEEELYTFIDIFKMAIQLVEEHSDIREQLMNQFDEIMIDEYQDNNDLQELFIEKISHNNVYMVGDIKQSIYRFRNANPNIFKQKYESFQNHLGGIKIDLNQNFRSRQEVLDDINLLFNQLMNLEIGGANYKESHQMIFGNKMYIQEGKTEKNYQLEIKKYPVDLKGNKEEKEIFLIADDINQKIKEQYPIFDRDLKKVRPIQYSDICILLDKSKNFELYKKIFEYKKIPLSIYKDENLKNSMDIFIMNHLIKLVLKLKDKKLDTEFRYSLLSVSRSYLFAIEDEEIFQAFSSNQLEKLPAYQKAQSLVSYLEQESPLSFYQRLIQTFSIYEKLITTENIKSSEVRLEYFYELLKELVDKGYGIEEFSQYLDTLYEKEQDLSFNMNQEEENSCKIMTIHKSKGLEFPICYFASFTSKFNLQDMNDSILYDPVYPIVIPSNIEEMKPTILKFLLKESVLREEIGEKIRLLYVALTRCCEKMILILPEDEEFLKEKEKFRSFANMIYSQISALQPYMEDVDVCVTKDYLKSPSFVNKTIEEAEKILVKEISIEEKELEKSHYSKESGKLLSAEKQNLLNMGTKIHEILEFMDFKNPDYEGLDDFVKNKIEAFLSQPFIKENLDEKIIKEYEFIDVDEHSVSNGVIDLLIEKKEEMIIVDYKLKNIDDKKYKDQLEGYKRALAKRTSKKISCYLYSILDEKLEKIL